MVMDDKFGLRPKDALTHFRLEIEETAQFDTDDEELEADLVVPILGRAMQGQISSYDPPEAGSTVA